MKLEKNSRKHKQILKGLAIDHWLKSDVIKQQKSFSFRQSENMTR